MSQGALKIVKAKTGDWGEPERQRDPLKLVNGCNFLPIGEWAKAIENL